MNSFETLISQLDEDHKKALKWLNIARKKQIREVDEYIILLKNKKK